MMKRTVDMLLGDPGDDGHGKSSLVRAKVIGEDVSNEALKAGRLRAEAATGVELHEILSEYEDPSIFSEAAADMLRAGLKFRKCEVFEKGFSIDDMDELIDEGLLPKNSPELFSAGGLLLEYFGFGIEGFKYKVVDYRDSLIVGSYTEKAPLSSFGYGLFSQGLFADF